jgi:hypothetical protein
MNRLVILSDESLEPLAGALRLRLEAIARQISAENLAPFLDATVAGVIEDLALATHSSAFLWGRGEACHSAVWASETSRNLAGRATADCNEGLVARVFDSARGDFFTGEGFDDWTNLGRLSGRALVSMACVPVLVSGRVVGALALASFEERLDETVLRPLTRAAEMFGRLAEARILRECLGMEVP